MESKTISIVIPIYNEESLVATLVSRVQSVMDELVRSHGLKPTSILVNDGSTDATLPRLRELARADPRFIILDLSRNFGHQPAIQAGLEHATRTVKPDAVVIMDGDLQDPPEVIPSFIEAWRDGAEVVIGARRTRAESGGRRLLFNTFHRVLGRLSDLPMETGSGVFGLLDACALRELAQLPERNRFLPGLRQWIGFRQMTVLYDRADRASGRPKQSFGRLVRYGLDAIFSFSQKPLRAIWSLGFLISITSVLYAIYLIILRLFKINVVPGFTTPTVAILLLGGIQLISIGVLGEYLGRIYDEVKQRPHYIIRDVITRGVSTPSLSTPGVSASESRPNTDAH